MVQGMIGQTNNTNIKIKTKFKVIKGPYPHYSYIKLVIHVHVYCNGTCILYTVYLISDQRDGMYYRSLIT